MAETDYRKITLDGLWNNNPATVQILGLCPLLAVTGTVVNALGLGLATLVVLMGSNGAVSLIRGYVTDAVRLPAFVMIIAALVTVIEMLMRAFTFELYEILGIFIPLIVTNCTVLGRADAFASKNPVLPSLLDGFMMGAGFLVILVILGGMRELIGQGTLFDNMQLLLRPRRLRLAPGSVPGLPRLPVRGAATGRLYRPGADHRRQERYRPAPQCRPQGPASGPAHRQPAGTHHRQGELKSG